MEIKTLINLVIYQTDEVLPYPQILEYINDAIAEINTQCPANFPFTEVDDYYLAIPETYQRSLLATFASGRVKQNDASLEEANQWQSRFATNLNAFKSNYVIPEAYAPTDRIIYNDFSDSPYTGGW